MEKLRVIAFRDMLGVPAHQERQREISVQQVQTEIAIECVWAAVAASSSRSRSPSIRTHAKLSLSIFHRNLSTHRFLAGRCPSSQVLSEIPGWSNSLLLQPKLCGTTRNARREVQARANDHCQAASRITRDSTRRNARSEVQGRANDYC